MICDEEEDYKEARKAGRRQRRRRPLAEAAAAAWGVFCLDVAAGNSKLPERQPEIGFVSQKSLWRQKTGRSGGIRKLNARGGTLILPRDW